MKDTSLRHSFDQAAHSYDKVRPGYPQEIIEAIISKSALQTPSKILEVGVGTGQITLPFAKLGYDIVGLELGEHLAEQARQNLRAYPKVNIEQADFETWNSEQTFGLLLSAQAFHWIDTKKGLKQAARVLKPHATIALVWTLDESHTDFQKATNPIYEKFIPQYPNRLTPLEGYHYYQKALSVDPLFEHLSDYNQSWEISYDKEDYLKLQDTYSNHRALSQETRAAFHHELAKVIDSFGGKVLRLYKTVLMLARKLSP